MTLMGTGLKVLDCGLDVILKVAQVERLVHLPLLLPQGVVGGRGADGGLVEEDHRKDKDDDQGQSIRLVDASVLSSRRHSLLLFHLGCVLSTSLSQHGALAASKGNAREQEGHQTSTSKSFSFSVFSERQQEKKKEKRPMT